MVLKEIEKSRETCKIVKEFRVKLFDRMKKGNFAAALSLFNNLKVLNLNSMDPNDTKCLEFINEVSIMMPANKKTTHSQITRKLQKVCDSAFNAVVPIANICLLKSDLFVEHIPDPLKRCQWLKLAAELYLWKLNTMNSHMVDDMGGMPEVYVPIHSKLLYISAIILAHDPSPSAKIDSFEIFHETNQIPICQILPFTFGPNGSHQYFTCIFRIVRSFGMIYKITTKEIVSLLDNVVEIYGDELDKKTKTAVMVYKNSLKINDHFQRHFATSSNKDIPWPWWAFMLAFVDCVANGKNN